MFSFGSSEIAILVIVALLLFGPDKIPQLARSVSRFMREFNKYKSIFESTLRQEIYEADPPKPDTTPIADRMSRAVGATSALADEKDAAPADPVGLATADPPAPADPVGLAPSDPPATALFDAPEPAIPVIVPAERDEEEQG